MKERGSEAEFLDLKVNGAELSAALNAVRFGRLDNQPPMWELLVALSASTPGSFNRITGSMAKPLAFTEGLHNMTIGRPVHEDRWLINHHLSFAMERLMQTGGPLRPDTPEFRMTAAAFMYRRDMEAGGAYKVITTDIERLRQAKTKRKHGSLRISSYTKDLYDQLERGDLG